VQSFLHGANCAVAHLHFEAVLADPTSYSAPQAGRPYTVTDPNPPIQYRDLWFLLGTAAITPFRTIVLQPVPMLLLAYAIEFYSLLPYRQPLLRKMLPQLTGDIKHIQPGIFSVSTHVFATNDPAQRSVKEGGLGYRGVITTLEGMCQEVLDWNHEHASVKGLQKGTKYVSSVSLADEIARAGTTAANMKA